MGSNTTGEKVTIRADNRVHYWGQLAAYPKNSNYRLVEEYAPENVDQKDVVILK